MRYFKSIKRVLIPISICTLVILLIGCGKSSDGLAGREFKGVVDGKTDAIFTLKMMVHSKWFQHKENQMLGKNLQENMK